MLDHEKANLNYEMLSALHRWVRTGERMVSIEITKRMDSKRSTVWVYDFDEMDGRFVTQACDLQRDVYKS